MKKLFGILSLFILTLLSNDASATVTYGDAYLGPDGRWHCNYDQGIYCFYGVFSEGSAITINLDNPIYGVIAVIYSKDDPNTAEINECEWTME